MKIAIDIKKGMVKQKSVREKVIEAIKDYNDTVTNPLRSHIYIKMSTKELKGLLYNSFRRRFPTIFNPSSSRTSSVRVFSHNLECKFNQERTLVEMIIDKSYNQHCMFDDRLDDYLIFTEIKEILKSIDSTRYLANIIERIGHPPEVSKYEISPGIF